MVLPRRQAELHGALLQSAAEIPVKHLPRLRVDPLSATARTGAGLHRDRVVLLEGTDARPEFRCVRRCRVLEQDQQARLGAVRKRPVGAGPDGRCFCRSLSILGAAL